MPIAPSKYKLMSVPINGDSILALIIAIYMFKIIADRDSRIRFKNGVISFFKSPIDTSIFAVIVFMLLSILFASKKSIAINETARFISYIILYFIIKYDIIYEKFKRNALVTYISVSCLISIFGIVQYFTDKNILIRVTKDSAYKRISSTLENPNNLGAFLLFVVFILILLMFYEKNRVLKLIYFSCSTLVVVNIILTSSRNALAGLVIGITLLLIIYNWKLVFLFIGVCGLSTLLPSVMHRISNFGEMSQNINRLKAWKISILMFKDHPFTGVGNGNFVERYTDYYAKNPSLAIQEKLFHPHNLFLKLLCELGLFALVAFICFLVFLLIYNWSVMKKAKKGFYKAFYVGLFVSTNVFIFMNMLDNFMSAPKVMAFFWILVALMQTSKENFIESKYY
jgi:O-antigen ligase